MQYFSSNKDFAQAMQNMKKSKIYGTVCSTKSFKKIKTDKTQLFGRFYKKGPRNKTSKSTTLRQVQQPGIRNAVRIAGQDIL